MTGSANRVLAVSASQAKPRWRWWRLRRKARRMGVELRGTAFVPDGVGYLFDLDLLEPKVMWKATPNRRTP